jgi:hypothetical protein
MAVQVEEEPGLTAEIREWMRLHIALIDYGEDYVELPVFLTKVGMDRRTGMELPVFLTKLEMDKQAALWGGSLAGCIGTGERGILSK